MSDVLPKRTVSQCVHGLENLPLTLGTSIERRNLQNLFSSGSWFSLRGTCFLKFYFQSINPTKRNEPMSLARVASCFKKTNQSIRNSIRRSRTNSNDNDAKESGNTLSPASKKREKIDPKGCVLAERERIDEIKTLIESEQYEEALRSLMSDTSADFHYFNQVKSEVLGKEHDDAFARRHGKLFERTPPAETLNTCIWSGVNGFGHPMRCHNDCAYHLIEKVIDPLRVERPKQMDHCVYHVKYCMNTDNHRVPMKIRIENEFGLCNECFLLRNGEPPKEMLRVPGTRRKRN